MALAGLVLCGCTTNADIVASRLIASTSSSRPPSTVADCIYSAAVGISEGLDVRKMSIGSAIHVSADQGGHKLALYDVSVEPTDKGSIVSIRAASNVWGGTNEPPELHLIVERCAK